MLILTILLYLTVALILSFIVPDTEFYRLVLVGIPNHPKWLEPYSLGLMCLLWLPTLIAIKVALLLDSKL